MTKHPAHSAARLEIDLMAFHSLLTESRNDEKAALIKIAKRCIETLKSLRQEMAASERQRQYQQQIFCDKLTFEFSVNADFSASYVRDYQDMVIDGETIKNIISNERQLQNMNDEYLFARVTITDTDPET
jgi:hypothetical protein